MGEYGIDHNSTPYNGAYYEQSAPQAPPPPPTALKKSDSSDKSKPIEIDIESAISRTIVEQIAESRSFGTSVLQGVKKFVVPIGTILDIISSFFRVLTLGFLIALPELYNTIFYPKPDESPVWHYAILITSMVGVALGIPVALFAAVYSLVTIKQKQEAAMHIKSRKLKNERIKYFKGKIRGAWGYISVAFFCLAITSVPFVLSRSDLVPQFIIQLLAEIIFILVPAISAIVTMITEREAGADPQERSAQLGITVALYNAMSAGFRLAHGQGTYKDSAAMRSTIDGDISASIDAGVKEEPDIKYLTLAEIAEKLGRSPAKDDPFRRTLSNIVSAAYKRGTYAIVKHPIKGYLVPESAYIPLFDKYTYDRPTTTSKVTPFKVVPPTKSKGNTATIEEQPGIFVKAWRALFGTGTPPIPEEKEESTPPPDLVVNG
jgi:hypothetical protein